MTTVLSNGATGTGLVEQVQSRLTDFTQRGSASDTGDGTTTVFKLPDANINAASVSCSVAGSAKTETTHWTLDYNSGWFTFLSAPALAEAILWSYSYRIWTPAMVKTAINASIDYLAGDFYTVGYDDNIVPDSTTKEFALPPDTMKVIRVERSSDGNTWTREDEWSMRSTNTYQVTAHTSDYLATTGATTLTLASGNGASVTPGDVLKDAASNELVKAASISTDTLTVTRGHRSTTATTHASAATWTKWSDKLLYFLNAPASGYLRVTVSKRAQRLVNDSDTLEYTAGMSPRAQEPIILYSCWHLLNQRVPLRVRDNLIARASDEYVITPAQLTQAADRFWYMFQSHVEHEKPRPQAGRRAL